MTRLVSLNHLEQFYYKDSLYLACQSYIFVKLSRSGGLWGLAPPTNEFNTKITVIDFRISEKKQKLNKSKVKVTT